MRFANIHYTLPFMDLRKRITHLDNERIAQMHLLSQPYISSNSCESRTQFSSRILVFSLFNLVNETIAMRRYKYTYYTHINPIVLTSPMHPMRLLTRALTFLSNASVKISIVSLWYQHTNPKTIGGVTHQHAGR